MKRTTGIDNQAGRKVGEPKCFRQAIVREVNRRMQAGECSSRLLNDLVAVLADYISADPRAANRDRWISDIAAALPLRVSENVDVRLANDPDYLFNTKKFNEGMVQ